MQAPAECAALDHGGQAFGDDRHLGDVAPVRRGEIAALKEVEPQGPEQVATGRRRASKRRHPGSRESAHASASEVHSRSRPERTLVAESGRGGPQQIATRQPCGLDSWKFRRTVKERRIERIALAG